MTSNTFSRNWYKYVSCLRHSTYIQRFYHRIKIRCYKMIRAYGSVHDNGNVVPQKVVDKIFQPFFTTKPTGSGTGLGLSLSYDIIKAHGGEIKVETKEGQGASFVIILSK
jgi:signal transduction histidine kinase